MSDNMPHNPTGKNQYVGFRAPKAVIESAKAAARADNRSLSNYILNLITDDLARAADAQTVPLAGPATITLKAAEEPADYNSDPPPHSPQSPDPILPDHDLLRHGG